MIHGKRVWLARLALLGVVIVMYIPCSKLYTAKPKGWFNQSWWPQLQFKTAEVYGHKSPLFCFSASQKRRGCLCGSDILSRANTPPLPPRLDVDIRLQTVSLLPKLVRQRSAFAFLVLQKLDGQDRLTEVGHSVDGGVFQALRGFVLSMFTLIADTLAIDRRRIP